MLFFIHIPRTGGTTLNRLFYLAYGNRHIGFYPPPPGPIKLTSEQHAALYSYFNSAMSFSSTVIRRDPVLMNSWSNPCFVTILRNPIDRVISDYLAFFQKQGISMERIPDYLENYVGSLQAFTQQNENQNMMTRYLSGADEFELLDRMHLERAKEELASMDYVLISEFFDLTLAPLLKDFPEIHNWYREKKNTNPAREDGFEYQSVLEMMVVDELKQLNHLDIELYRFGCNLVAQHLSKFDFKGLFQLLPLCDSTSP